MMIRLLGLGVVLGLLLAAAILAAVAVSKPDEDDFSCDEEGYPRWPLR